MLSLWFCLARARIVPTTQSHVLLCSSQPLAGAGGTASPPAPLATCKVLGRRRGGSGDGHGGGEGSDREQPWGLAGDLPGAQRDVQTSGGWGRIDRDASVDAMLAYADAGLCTFDMADIYGPAEDLYGIFINRVRRERPPELLEEIRGLTKWVPPPVKMTRSYVEDNINRSRKRMDVAALDMLQFHWWDYSNLGYLDALKHITDLKEEGKIKTVALTNFDTDRLQIILENGIPVVSNQVQHSVVDMRPQQRMAKLCQLTGVKLITYGTVMGGLLSEKFLDTNVSIPFAGPPLNTPSMQKYKKMVDAWGGWSLFQALLQTLKKVSVKHGVSIATVAVRYILNQTSVAGSMVGVRLGLSEHIKDTNAIFSLELDEEDMNSSSEASKKGRNLMDIIGDCGDEYRA